MLDRSFDPPETGADGVTTADGSVANQKAQASDVLRIGLLLPLSGPSGLIGPSGRNCAELAAEEINHRGGLLGRRVQVVVADGGMSFAASAKEGMRLIEDDGVSALIGTHPSGVRELLSPMIGTRAPYIYTPIFEGGALEPGTFYLGETAHQQLSPVLPWMKNELGVRRWMMIGNDYRWPRDVHKTAGSLLAAQKADIVGEHLVPLGTEDFTSIIEWVAASAPDALVVSLIGSDAVIFHRAFARAGLDRKIWRLGLLTEENTLLGVGADCSNRLLSSAAYFALHNSPENTAFVARYRGRFGDHAPMLNSIGQSCYEGLMFLNRIASAAGSLHVDDLLGVADGMTFNSPRGAAKMIGRHLVKDMHLAEARGVEFRIRATFKHVSPAGGILS